MFAWIALAAVVVLMGFIRLAPSDPLDWNSQPELGEDKDFAGGVFRVVDAGPDGLARLAEIAAQTPRTSVLVGTPEDGMMTFVTRSQLWGFPDYTTISQEGAQLKIYARLRFGKSDLGVNRARIDDWVAQLTSQSGH